MNDSAQAFLLAEDPEQTLIEQYTQRIAEDRVRYGNARHKPPHQRLRVLLVGYSGACNTGADVRTGEIIRQIRALLGSDRVTLGVVTVGNSLPAQWGDVVYEPFSSHPPDFVRDTCSRYDAVVVSEGSLFTSTFSNSLASLLIAFMAMAEAQGKPAVAYGAEADAMSPSIEAFAREHLRDSLLIARNTPSRDRLKEIGLNARSGTDTGWTFIPDPEIPATETLKAMGWDGRSTVLALCPVNPFCWPLEPDPMRAMMLKVEGRRDPSHYGGVSFFQESEDSHQRFTGFMDAMAEAVRRHMEKQANRCFPLIIGMEALDRHACEELSARLDAPQPVIAGDHDQHTIVGLLGASDRLVSARYHAILLSMRAGVPAIGLAYDQRVPALLAEAKRPDLSLDVNDSNLTERLSALLDSLAIDGDAVRRAFTGLADRKQAVQHAMGRQLVDALAEFYPGMIAKVS